jgi:LmbE family N-acetylglucosaminyl deacetylase
LSRADGGITLRARSPTQEAAMILDDQIRSAKRPLFFIAHQDDEVGYGGLIQRLGPRTKFVFMTNGDGIAPAVKADPKEYAEMRKAEALKSLAVVGIPEANVNCLDFSEIEIYRQMANLADRPDLRADALRFFEGVRDAARDAVAAVDPDLAFAIGFQGGMPEHDLAHFFCMLALRELTAKTGRAVPFYHLPEYELTILIPFRFGPWYKGERLHLSLTDAEFERKTEMLNQYPSQQDLFAKFARVFRGIEILGKVLRKDWSMRGFYGTEQISPVPPDFDYAKPPYAIDFFNYMFDDFEGRPIKFRPSIQPIVRHFLGK